MPKKKTYIFNFVVENATREEAETVADILIRRGPALFMTSFPTTEEEVAEATSHELQFVGMNELEEDSDGEDETPS